MKWKIPHMWHIPQRNGNNFKNMFRIKIFLIFLNVMLVSSQTSTDNSDWLSDCWTTGCQSKTWAVVGCAQYKKTEMDRIPCDDGYKYHCCTITNSDQINVGPNSTTDIDTYLDSFYIAKNDSSQTLEYVDYVKQLLWSSAGITAYPDPFPCTDIDPEKQFIVQEGDTYAIRFCDYCPYLPYEKLTNVFFNKNASFTWSNTVYIECVGNCLNETKCVALSYDSEEHVCYGFNSTSGSTFEEKDYTSVIFTQPRGTIRDWIYTKNTKLTSNTTNLIKTKTFLECLDSCSKDQKNNCLAISYDYASTNCSMFNTTIFNRVDYVYGNLVAINLNISQSANSNRWRYSWYNNFVDDADTTLNVLPKTPVKRKFGSFANPSCKLQALAGCDQATGFQQCYYPEFNGSTSTLPLCPDSRYKAYETIEQQNSLLEKCMTDCTKSDKCVGVSFSTTDLSCTMLDYRKLLQQQLSNQKPYILKNPTRINLIQQNFDLFFGSEIEQSTQNQWTIIKAVKTSNEIDCVSSCYSTSSCVIVSFNWATQMCVLSKGGAVSKSEPNAMTFSRKSDFKSPKLGFAYLFSTGVDGKKLQTFTTDCVQQNCQSNVDGCLNSCLNNNLCKFVGITYTTSPKVQTVCSLYGMNDTSILWNVQQETYYRLVTSIKFTQSEVDNIFAFQPTDFWSCFRQSSKQSQSTLQPTKNFDGPPSTNTNISVRRKRGFSRRIGDFFKKAGEAIVGVVKDVGKTIVKTAETVGKVVTGDFKGALKTVQEIPIVQDVKHVIETGAEIVGDISKGNWKDVGKGVLDLGISSLGLIPGPGKFAGKIVEKTIGKSLIKDISKSVDIKNSKSPDKKDNKRDIDKDNENDKDKNDNNETKQCERRPKRAPNVRNKPGSSSKKRTCPDDQCTNVGVAHMDQKYKPGCNGVDVGRQCEFVCNAGYDESDVGPRCKEDANKKTEFEPALKCDPQSCGTGEFAVGVKAYRKLLTDLDITGYHVKFDQRRRMPVLSVSFHDILQHQTGSLVSNFGVSRTSSFSAHPCTLLHNDQSNKDTDFKMTPSQAALSGKTAWDRGHYTPFQAQAFSYKSAITSNMFVNVAPQDPYTNETPWRLVESFVFCALKGKSAITMTGVCDATQEKTLSGLDVPTCYWKLICYVDPADDTVVIGFISDNGIIKAGDDAAKKKRSEETKKFRSQKDVIAKSGVASIPAAWLTSARTIFKGRQTTGAFNPPNAVKCAAALDLPTNLPNFGKKTTGRRKRAVSYGCSESDLKETLALFASMDDVGDANLNSDGSSFGGVSNSPSAACGKRLVGYYPSWGTAKFTNIQARALTHAIFAFFQTFEDGSVRLGTADPTNTKNAAEDLDIATSRLATFKRIGQSFSNLKLMFAIGGWENSNYFSAIAANPQKRLKLIASILEVMNTHGFDGVDIDWEYPVTGGAHEGVPADKGNYVTLLQEIRNTFTEHQKQIGRSEPFLLSFAGAAGQWTLDPGVDLPNLLKYADFANVMSYDFFGAWTSKWGAYTGPPSPLFFGNPKGFSGKVNADWTIKYYVCRSKLPHKVNMGVPFYGRYWKNVGDPIDKTDGMWRMATAVNGVFEGGYVTWKEIKEKWLTDPGFKVTMHPKAKVPYAWNGGTKTFLGFENPESLAFKVKYAEDMNLGGLMIWALDQDDDNYSMLETVLKANLCKITDPNTIKHRCPPITEKRWWTPEDGYDKAGMCGKTAPLYQGYYPVCDPDDPGYSCCGAFGYCGSGPDFCDCPTCVDYLKNPEKILDEPIKPTIPVNWYFLNDPDGKRGRCGPTAPLLNNKIPICNPDDVNAHCCSNGGYCGAKKEFCECSTCVDFKKNPNFVFKTKQ